MLLKFRNVEFNAKTITYGRNNKPAEADFLGIDSDSQDSKLDNMDFHVEGYIYGKKVEETRIKLEKALERRQAFFIFLVDTPCTTISIIVVIKACSLR